MTISDVLPDADAQVIRDGIAAACLHGSDQDPLDTPEGALRLVAATNLAADHGNRLLADAVTGARHAGESWAAIAGVLGVSEQAAQQRFGTTVDEPEPATTQQRIIRGVTAFNEMSELERAQVDGWHLVGFAPFRLVVEVSDQPWEHQRLTLPSHALLRTMEQDGWQIVGVWGLWTYLKRPARTASNLAVDVGS